jgi:hypothetical protein
MMGIERELVLAVIRRYIKAPIRSGCKAVRDDSSANAAPARHAQGAQWPSSAVSTCPTRAINSSAAFGIPETQALLIASMRALYVQTLLLCGTVLCSSCMTALLT